MIMNFLIQSNVGIRTFPKERDFPNRTNRAHFLSRHTLFGSSLCTKLIHSTVPPSLRPILVLLQPISYLHSHSPFSVRPIACTFLHAFSHLPSAHAMQQLSLHIPSFQCSSAHMQGTQHRSCSDCFQARSFPLCAQATECLLFYPPCDTGPRQRCPLFSLSTTGVFASATQCRNPPGHSGFNPDMKRKMSTAARKLSRSTSGDSEFYRGRLGERHMRMFKTPV